MKKFILPALFLGTMAFGSTSCKKEYTCECTFTSPTPNLSFQTGKVKKSDAESSCSSAETTYKIADSAAKCTLK